MYIKDREGIEWLQHSGESMESRAQSLTFETQK